VPINFTLSADKPEAENKTGAADQGDSRRKADVIIQNTSPDTAKYTLNNYLKGPLFLSSNSPLYVVDDVQVDNLNDLKPENIQSISILKDKTRTAWYGEKGKNGVIIVTTKEYALKHKADVIIIKN
jgi:TonB-dependent SusC/RagA subfamily outer membrane receptor